MIKQFIVLLLSILLFSITHLISQSPTAFNYQGILLTDEDFPIAEEQATLRIGLIAGETSSQVVYSELHSVITSPIGYFSIDIGKGSQLNGDFSSIDWGGQPHFLSIEYLQENGTYKPLGNIQLLSVPYALFAHYAEEGASGHAGPQGPAGSNGLTGPQGPTGVAGGKGPPGRSGSCGPSPPAPPSGAQGQQGPQGPEGEPGDNGLPIMVKSSKPIDNPVRGQIYVDDGTNTADGKIGLRYYTGSVWIDI